jgi:hypothetical protein
MHPGKQCRLSSKIMLAATCRFGDQLGRMVDPERREEEG